MKLKDKVLSYELKKHRVSVFHDTKKKGPVTKTKKAETAVKA